MKIIYLASPYSAPTFAEVSRNVDTVRRVALELAAKRIPFISTVLQTMHFDTLLADEDPGYEHWISCSLEVLKRCDAVMLVPGWEHSNGVRRELELARARGLPVFEDLNALADWIGGEP